MKQEKSNKLGIAVLALTKIPNVGAKTVKILAEGINELEEITPRLIWKYIYNRLDLLNLKGKAVLSIESFSIKEFENIFFNLESELKGLDLMSYFDINYPSKLYKITSPPLVYWYKGNSKLVNYNVLTIVGTRRNSDYGSLVVKEIINNIDNNEIIPASGFADGIDDIAYSFCMRYKYKFLGVIPYSYKYIPRLKGNKILQCIENNGLIISMEFGEEINKGSFINRNKLIAGLSDSIFVVEASLNSGSLNTVEFGINFKKQIYSIPGSIFSNVSEGCNSLSKNKNVIMINSINHLSQIFGKINSNNKEEDIFINAIKLGYNSIEKISNYYNIKTDKVRSELTLLEMKGIVRINLFDEIEIL